MYSYLGRATIRRTAAGGSHFESYSDCWLCHTARVGRLRVGRLEDGYYLSTLFVGGTMNEDGTTKALNGVDIRRARLEGVIPVIGHRMARLIWTMPLRGSTHMISAAMTSTIGRG
jgi:hypothetical protein